MDEASLPAIAASIIAASVGGVAGEAAKAAVQRVRVLAHGKLIARGQDELMQRVDREPQAQDARRDLETALVNAIRLDPEFGQALSAAVRAAQIAGVHGRDTVVSGNVSSTISQNTGMAVGGNVQNSTLHQGDVRHGDVTNRTTNKTVKRGGVFAWLALGAVAFIVLVVILLVKVGSAVDATNADMSCGDFLTLDLASRDQVIKRVAVDLGNDVLAGPFGVQNAEYYCSRHPEWTLRYMITGSDSTG